MHKFKFGGIKDNPHVYLDENILRMMVNLRGNLGRLAQTELDRADELASKGDSASANEYRAKAVGVIDYSLTEMPLDRVPHSIFNYIYPEIYYRAGAKEKAHKLLEDMMAKAKDELNYYKVVYEYELNQARDEGNTAYLTQLQQGGFTERHELREWLYILQEMDMAAKKYDDATFAETIDKDFQQCRMSFVKLDQQSGNRQTAPASNRK